MLDGELLYTKILEVNLCVTLKAGRLTRSALKLLACICDMLQLSGPAPFLVCGHLGSCVMVERLQNLMPFPHECLMWPCFTTHENHQLCMADLRLKLKTYRTDTQCILLQKSSI